MGFLRKVSVSFAAGCLGGVANGMAVWLAGLKGITASFGVSIAPRLTAPWMYQRVVWGGIWGALFLLPFLRRSVLGRGFLYSLGPTVVQLLVVFPYQADKGLLGLQLGNYTPLFVLVFNFIWGLAAAIWVALADER
jgi:hypothetical protein